MKSILRERNLELLILFFFVFGSIFPTLRILTIGGQTSGNLREYIFSVIPELISVLVLSFSGILFYKNKHVIKLLPFDWILICFALTNVLLGFYIAKDVLMSMYGFRMSYFPIIFYFIFRFGDKELLINIIHKTIIWFFIIGIIGLILYFGFYEQMIWMLKKTNPLVQEYFIVRMTSIFWSPVLFSTIMVTTFTYFYYKFLESPLWYYYLILGLSWSCILLSVTRGGFVVISFGFIFITIIQKKWKLSAQIFLLLIAIFIIIGYYISTPLTFLYWILRSVSDTVGMKEGITRVDLWLKAIENFKTHPFGFGLGKAGHVAARFYKDSKDNIAIYSTDGWYLKLANETGIWGLLSYFFLAIYFFAICIKSKFIKFTENRFVWLFALFMMVNIQNIVSNVLDFYLFSFFYWGVIGLIINILYSKIKKA
ncbi:MAG: O-antigen ligase family protein [Bacteroidota bacterium]